MTQKENLLRTINHDNPEWVPNGLEAVKWIFPPVIERPAQAGLDDFNVKWDIKKDAEGGTYPAHNGNTITDISKWREQITFPDLQSMDWNSVSKHAGKINREENLLCGFVEMGLFERSYLLLGMDEALISFLTMPDEMEQLISAIADYKIKFIELFDDTANLDMIWYGDDWGTQNNLFLPPKIWRKIIKPHTQRIYNCMKKRNIIINQHSCGKIEDVFTDIVEMGAQIYNPAQPCNDLAKLKNKFAGKITFCGGIDSQFVLAKPNVTEEEIRIEVRKRIDELAEGGGYIAAPSHDVPYNKNLLDAMNDEIRTYGKYKK
ncbi:MAG: hypothetical protein DRI44_06040 [Chlamydiae bacterium]|nr:MAG: hypothetical protein DRI44_06040 [Chlamydiota bacterium]